MSLRPWEIKAYAITLHLSESESNPCAFRKLDVNLIGQMVRDYPSMVVPVLLHVNSR